MSDNSPAAADTGKRSAVGREVTAEADLAGKVRSNKWTQACRIGGDFQALEGSVAEVAAAVRRGADLRRFSTYDPPQTGLVEETMALQTTWVFDAEHVGGLSTLRHPADCGLGFFKQASLAYWVFGVTAPQTAAFVPLDGAPADGATGRWIRVDEHPFVGERNSPWLSKYYQWWIRDDWEEVHSHDENGTALLGHWEDVRQAAAVGRAIKVGIRNPWSHLADGTGVGPEHDVFIECGTQFAHVDGGFFAAMTIPTCLLRPTKPLRFVGEAFEPGWLLVRTDGRVQRQVLRPSTMEWNTTWTRHSLRWFAR